MRSESLAGFLVGVAGLLLFATLITLAATHTIDDVTWWALAGVFGRFSWPFTWSPAPSSGGTHGGALGVFAIIVLLAAIR